MRDKLNRRAFEKFVKAERELEALQCKIVRRQGADAFDRGASLDECPFEKGTRAAVRWTAGYVERRAQRRAQMRPDNQKASEVRQAQISKRKAEEWRASASEREAEMEMAEVYKEDKCKRDGKALARLLDCAWSVAPTAGKRLVARRFDKLMVQSASFRRANPMKRGAR